MLQLLRPLLANSFNKKCTYSASFCFVRSYSRDENCSNKKKPGCKMIKTGNSELDKELALWCKWDRNETTLKEVQDLINAKDWKTLSTRMLNRLEFGTAGLRAAMRAGFDSMNDLVIVQTAQGLCEYLLRQFPDEHERGIVFGYDGRYNSKRFAELSAAIFLNNKVKVYLYSRMVATPFVPYAVVKLKCLAGVMVTASHNPKEDNGYKVYWANGAQIIPPHDKCIQKSILMNLEPKPDSWETSTVEDRSREGLCDPYEQMFEKYYRNLLCNIPEKYRKINDCSEKRIVYTAMHGVGYPFVQEAFKVASLLPPIPVVQQIEPDPEFPTVKFPNPEEGKSALELSIKTADENCVTVILANDPDADRLACAEKDVQTGKWKVFNGNELGALIGWWSIQTYKEISPIVRLSEVYQIASTVSSKILRSMAAVDGYNFEETLTGFKWIANRGLELMAEGKEVIFGFEEAIGYMFNTTVLDKDGVSAAAHLATMVAYLNVEKNLTLTKKLDEIYRRYGYHCTNNSYLFCYDQAVIKRLFNRLRRFQMKDKTYPSSILNGKYKIKYIRDLTNGVDTSKPDGLATLPVSSSSQMITFTFENNMVVTLRTSGTEPKIKYYAELCGRPEDKDWEQLGKTLDEMVAAVVEEFLQPQKNKLIPRKE